MNQQERCLQCQAVAEGTGEQCRNLSECRVGSAFLCNVHAEQARRSGSVLRLAGGRSKRETNKKRKAAADTNNGNVEEKEQKSERWRKTQRSFRLRPLRHRGGRGEQVQNHLLRVAVGGPDEIDQKQLLLQMAASLERIEQEQSRLNREMSNKRQRVASDVTVMPPLPLPPTIQGGGPETREKQKPGVAETKPLGQDDFTESSRAEWRRAVLESTDAARLVNAALVSMRALVAKRCRTGPNAKESARKTTEERIVSPLVLLTTQLDAVLESAILLLQKPSPAETDARKIRRRIKVLVQELHVRVAEARSNVEKTCGKDADGEPWTVPDIELYLRVASGREKCAGHAVPHSLRNWLFDDQFQFVSPPALDIASGTLDAEDEEWTQRRLYCNVNAHPHRVDFTSKAPAGAQLAGENILDANVSLRFGTGKTSKVRGGGGTAVNELGTATASGEEQRLSGNGAANKNGRTGRVGLEAGFENVSYIPRLDTVNKNGRTPKPGEAEAEAPSAEKETQTLAGEWNKNTSNEPFYDGQAQANAYSVYRNRPPFLAVGRRTKKGKKESEKVQPGVPSRRGRASTDVEEDEEASGAFVTAGEAESSREFVANRLKSESALRTYVAWKATLERLVTLHALAGADPTALMREHTAVSLQLACCALSVGRSVALRYMNADRFADLERLARLTSSYATYLNEPSGVVGMALLAAYHARTKVGSGASPATARAIARRTFFTALPALAALAASLLPLLRWMNIAVRPTVPSPGPSIHAEPLNVFGPGNLVWRNADELLSVAGGGPLADGRLDDYYYYDDGEFYGENYEFTGGDDELGRAGSVSRYTGGGDARHALRLGRSVDEQASSRAAFFTATARAERRTGAGKSQQVAAAKLVDGAALTQPGGWLMSPRTRAQWRAALSESPFYMVAPGSSALDETFRRVFDTGGRAGDEDGGDGRRRRKRELSSEERRRLSQVPLETGSLERGAAAASEKPRLAAPVAPRPLFAPTDVPLPPFEPTPSPAAPGVFERPPRALGRGGVVAGDRVAELAAERAQTREFGSSTGAGGVGAGVGGVGAGAEAAQSLLTLLGLGAQVLFNQSAGGGGAAGPPLYRQQVEYDPEMLRALDAAQREFEESEQAAGAGAAGAAASVPPSLDSLPQADDKISDWIDLDMWSTRESGRRSVEEGFGQWRAFELEQARPLRGQVPHRRDEAMSLRAAADRALEKLAAQGNATLLLDFDAPALAGAAEAAAGLRAPGTEPVTQLKSVASTGIGRVSGADLQQLARRLERAYVRGSGEAAVRTGQLSLNATAPARPVITTEQVLSARSESTTMGKALGDASARFDESFERAMQQFALQGDAALAAAADASALVASGSTDIEYALRAMIGGERREVVRLLTVPEALHGYLSAKWESLQQSAAVLGRDFATETGRLVGDSLARVQVFSGHAFNYVGRGVFVAADLTAAALEQGAEAARAAKELGVRYAPVVAEQGARAASATVQGIIAAMDAMEAAGQSATRATASAAKEATVQGLAGTARVLQDYVFPPLAAALKSVAAESKKLALDALESAAERANAIMLASFDASWSAAVQSSDYVDRVAAPEIERLLNEQVWPGIRAGLQRAFDVAQRGASRAYAEARQRAGAMFYGAFDAAAADSASAGARINEEVSRLTAAASAKFSNALEQARRQRALYGAVGLPLADPASLRLSELLGGNGAQSDREAREERRRVVEMQMKMERRREEQRRASALTNLPPLAQSLLKKDVLSAGVAPYRDVLAEFFNEQQRLQRRSAEENLRRFGEAALRRQAAADEGRRARYFERERRKVALATTAGMPTATAVPVTRLEPPPQSALIPDESLLRTDAERGRSRAQQARADGIGYLVQTEAERNWLAATPSGVAGQILATAAGSAVPGSRERQSADALGERVDALTDAFAGLSRAEDVPAAVSELDPASIKSLRIQLRECVQAKVVAENWMTWFVPVARVNEYPEFAQQCAAALGLAPQDREALMAAMGVAEGPVRGRDREPSTAKNSRLGTETAGPATLAAQVPAGGRGSAAFGRFGGFGDVASGAAPQRSGTQGTYMPKVPRQIVPLVQISPAGYGARPISGARVRL